MRMAGYYPGSTPPKPQRLVGDAVRRLIPADAAPAAAEWLASINLSGQDTWNYPLKTLPRLTGKSTHVIITEYDLPNPLIEPHDVVLDHEGNVWYSDFGQMFLGEMDPKTGAGHAISDPGDQARLPARHARSRYRQGRQSVDRRDVSERDRQVRPQDRQIRDWSTPKEWDSDAGQLGHLAVEGTPADDKVWIKNSAGGHIYRLDLTSNTFEDVGAPKDPAPASASAPTAFMPTRRTISICSISPPAISAARRQDQGADPLSDAHAELASAARPRRRPRPAVVCRIFRQCHRHARSGGRKHPGMEGADAVDVAL